MSSVPRTSNPTHVPTLALHPIVVQDDASTGRHPPDAGEDPMEEVRMKPPVDEVAIWKRRADNWRRKAWIAIGELQRRAGEAFVDEMIASWDAQEKREKAEDERRSAASDSEGTARKDGGQ